MDKVQLDSMKHFRAQLMLEMELLAILAFKPTAPSMLAATNREIMVSKMTDSKRVHPKHLILLSTMRMLPGF